MQAGKERIPEQAAGARAPNVSAAREEKPVAAAKGRPTGGAGGGTEEINLAALSHGRYPESAIGRVNACPQAAPPTIMVTLIANFSSTTTTSPRAINLSLM
jgi:hypothetical protein